jgi:hypothetical protein
MHIVQGFGNDWEHQNLTDDPQHVGRAQRWRWLQYCQRTTVCDLEIKG